MMSTTAVRPVDAIGRLHARARPDARVVCLVPSITELLFDLGIGDRLVGRTGFCVHPREFIRTVPKVGGTKDVDIEKIRDLEPTHLIVNIDENEKPTVELLAGFVPNVIVTHPLGPLDNLPLYRLLGGVFGREAKAAELCEAFQKAYFKAIGACADMPRERVLYLIWKSPWMTVSRDTYIARTLAAVGWDCVETAGARYPEIQLVPSMLEGVDRVFLSSEPFAFRARDVADVDGLLREMGVAPAVKVALIDGEMTSWYGSRAIRGMSYLARLREDSLSPA
ncbi:MAG TPA: helical backbone metal receptor [Burkholderiales bacterium]|nr:helical backbone metal receptor [Burkholderiales bacterium]